VTEASPRQRSLLDPPSDALRTQTKGDDVPGEAPAAKRAKSAAPKPATAWDAQRVAEWVLAIGESYGSDALALHRRDVDGRTLLLLDDALLIDIGVADRLHRARLLAGIAELRLSLSPEQRAIFTPPAASASAPSALSAPVPK
jgi:hypothetical protein